MNWLTWRQYRIEALISALVLVLLVTWLVGGGLVARSAYQSVGTVACLMQHVSAFECSKALLTSQSIILNLLFWLPLLVAVFIGALTVSREREGKNAYVAWTQSVTRGRWLAVRLSWIAGATLLVFLVIDLLLNWWSVPLLVGNDYPWSY